MRTGVLLTFGLLVLLVVAHQLWGTGLYEARVQSDLKDKFDRQTETKANPTTVGNTSTSGRNSKAHGDPTTTTRPPAAQLAPVEGHAVGIVKVPKIGVDDAVVEGASVPALRKGRPTTRDRRCLGSSETPQSPGTAPRTARRSTTSIGWRKTTRSRSERASGRGTTCSTTTP